MRTIIFCLLLAAFGHTVTAQTYQQIYAPLPLGLLHGNAYYGVELENTGSAPLRFYPRTVFDTDTTHLFLSGPDFLQYVIGTDGDRINALRRLARVLKSDRFVNNFLAFDDYNISSVWPKRYSAPVFCLSSSEEQCGNYTAFAAEVLIQSGLFSPDSISIVSGTGHVLFQVVYRGKNILVDLDPDEPCFLNHRSDGSFFSAQDIITDSASLYIDGTYLYTDPVSGVPSSLYSIGGDFSTLDSVQEETLKIQNYTTIFQSFTLGSPRSFTPNVDSGVWILPPANTACSLSWGVRLPKYCLSDIQSAITSSLMTEFDSAKQIGDTIAMNHLEAVFMDSLSTWFDTTAAAINDILSANQICSAADLSTPNDFMLHARGWGIFEKYMWVTLSLTTANDSITIGKDLRLPFLIHSVTTDQMLAVGDTFFYPGTTTNWLWNMKGTISSDGFDSLDRTSFPELSNGHVETLQSGWIPPHTTVTIELYWNPLIYNWANGMQALFGDSNAAHMHVTIDTPTAAAHVANSVSTIASDKQISVFPNPTTQTISLVSSGQGIAELTDATGRILKTFTIFSKTQSLSLDGIAAGVYFLTCNNITIAVQKLE